MNLKNIITAFDLHACGEPGRVITGGVLDVPGKTMFEKMKYFEKHHDDIRLRMLREPRGYPALCCNVILPPTHPQAAAGFIIMEQTEYPPMSGTNTICVATTLLESGMLKMEEPITNFTLEAPAGLIQIEAQCQNGKVTQIKFKNVPSFAVHLDVKVEVPTLGTVNVDVAYGGMFYAIADASQFGLKLSADEGRDITRITELVKSATAEQYPVVHPENPEIVGPTIGQLSAPSTNPKAHRKKCCHCFNWKN
ncbi:MAG: proline racemase [Chloroflexi bacterium OLB14]|nr:MAG: proline racemase [Chloroflexi bacterium OLB14]